MADYRSTVRDAAHDQREAARGAALRAEMLGGFAGVHSHLDAQASFDDRVASLPGPARPFLLAAKASPALVRLVDIVAGDNPRIALASLTVELPDWLATADGPTLVAAAELARAYELHRGAGELFRLAADVHPDRAYLYARAAVEYSTVGRPDEAEVLLDRARRLGVTVAVTAIAAAVHDDPEGTLAAVPRAPA